jgi:hypothetical protein
MISRTAEYCEHPRGELAVLGWRRMARSARLNSLTPMGG